MAARRQAWVCCAPIVASVEAASVRSCACSASTIRSAASAGSYRAVQPLSASSRCAWCSSLHRSRSRPAPRAGQKPPIPLSAVERKLRLPLNNVCSAALVSRASPLGGGAAVAARYLVREPSGPLAGHVDGYRFADAGDAIVGGASRNDQRAKGAAEQRRFTGRADDDRYRRSNHRLQLLRRPEPRFIALRAAKICARPGNPLIRLQRPASAASNR